MKVEDMSDMAKEKHAEFLLKFSSNLFTAFFITIIIGPLSLILSHILGPETIPNLSWDKVRQALTGWPVITFFVFEYFAAYLAINTQNKAYEIYTTLYPNQIEK